LASNFFEANVVFGAPEHLTAFGAAHFSPWFGIKNESAFLNNQVSIFAMYSMYPLQLEFRGAPVFYLENFTAINESR
jgi:hypothetical protein